VNSVHVRVRAAGEHYALRVGDVLEILEATVLTVVPGAPPAVLGVCNLRGRIVPVVALAQVLGLADGAQGRNRIVITQADAGPVGLAVDEVVDVGPLGEVSQETDSMFLDGATLVDGALVGVLDLPQLLSAAGTTQ
jgi:chemotaxis signal transduction protein